MAQRPAGKPGRGAIAQRLNSEATGMTAQVEKPAAQVSVELFQPTSPSPSDLLRTKCRQRWIADRRELPRGLVEETGGSFKVDVHDILTNSVHRVALGKPCEIGFGTGIPAIQATLSAAIDGSSDSRPHGV